MYQEAIIVVVVVVVSNDLPSSPSLPPPLRERGSNASWRVDAEVPEEHQDFLNDKAEMQKNESK